MSSKGCDTAEIQRIWDRLMNQLISAQVQVRLGSGSYGSSTWWVEVHSEKLCYAGCHIPKLKGKRAPRRKPKAPVPPPQPGGGAFASATA